MAFTTERIHYLIRSAQEKRNGAILQAHLDMNKAHEAYGEELERLLISGASDAGDTVSTPTAITEQVAK